MLYTSQMKSAFPVSPHGSSSNLVRRPWFWFCMGLIALTLVAMDALLLTPAKAGIHPAIERFLRESRPATEQLGGVSSIDFSTPVHEWRRVGQNWGRAEGTYRVSGPRGHGLLDVKLDYDGRAWTIRSAVLEIHSGSQMRLL
jgi:hypothetical protein